MKLNKIALGAAMALGVLASAHAADVKTNQGSGQVTFKGAVIEAPCSLVPGNGVGGDNQTVDMGQIANSALKKEGNKVNPTNFQLSLSGCDFSDADAKSMVAITFTGNKSKADGMFGAKAGVNLGIETPDGTQIKNGVESAKQQLIDGNNDLKFSAYLQGDGSSAAAVPGDFTSVVKFTLAYY